MSRVRCDYCNSSFEFTDQTNCPNCGATLSGNRDIERLMKQREEDERMKEKLRKESLDFIQDTFGQVQRRSKAMNALLPIVITIFVIVFITIIAINLIIANSWLF